MTVSTIAASTTFSTSASATGSTGSSPAGAATLFVGLDVHHRTSTACILDSTGRVVNTFSLRGPATRMIERLGELSRGHSMRVCFEASLGYGTIHQQLGRFADQVTVAHPGQVRMIFRSKQKNDRIDAQKLAKLLYLDEVPAVHVPREDVRAWRELIRTRGTLIAKRTMVKNQLHAVLRGRHMHGPFKGRRLFTRLGLAWLRELIEGAWQTDLAAVMRIELGLSELACLEEQIAKLARTLDRFAAQPAIARQMTLLQTIPGVGPRTAEAMLAYIDTPNRFARVSQVASYFGLVPSEDASAAVSRRGHITKQGPGIVRKLLTEASWVAIRKSEKLRAFYERVRAGKPERNKIALVAVAHKLIRIGFAMLRNGRPWDEKTAAERDADQGACVMGEM